MILKEFEMKRDWSLLNSFYHGATDPLVQGLLIIEDSRGLEL